MQRLVLQSSFSLLQTPTSSLSSMTEAKPTLLLILSYQSLLVIITTLSKVKKSPIILILCFSGISWKGSWSAPFLPGNLFKSSSSVSWTSSWTLPRWSIHSLVPIKPPQTRPLTCALLLAIPHKWAQLESTQWRKVKFTMEKRQKCHHKPTSYLHLQRWFLTSEQNN